MANDTTRKMFNAAFAAMDEEEKLKVTAEELREKRSELVRRIYEEKGSGPFNVRAGDHAGVYSIRKRESKDDDGKVTSVNYFFVSMAQNKMEDI